MPAKLRAPGAKAAPSRSETESLLQATDRQAAIEGVVVAPTSVRMGLETWTTRVTTHLMSSLQRHFPRLFVGDAETMRASVRSGVQRDMSAIRAKRESVCASQNTITEERLREVLRAHRRDLASKRAETFTKALLRAAGMEPSAVHNLFPRR